MRGGLRLILLNDGLDAPQGDSLRSVQDAPATFRALAQLVRTARTMGKTPKPSPARTTADGRTVVFPSAFVRVPTSAWDERARSLGANRFSLLAALTAAFAESLGRIRSGDVTLVIPVTLGGNFVTGIASLAFDGENLASVSIPDRVESIGPYAFYDNHLGSVKLPFWLETIGNSAFEFNAITSVVIPIYVTSIGNFAFQGNALAAVRLSSLLVSIGNYAFADNALTSVSIPIDVTKMVAGTFLTG